MANKEILTMKVFKVMVAPLFSPESLFKSTVLPTHPLNYKLTLSARQRGTETLGCLLRQHIWLSLTLFAAAVCSTDYLECFGSGGVLLPDVHTHG